MYASDAQLTASQVLHTFHHDELYLFLGSAFTTIGIVSAAFALLRRQLEPLVIWFAVFAIFYGQRLWLQLGLLALMIPPSAFFNRLRECSSYLVPVPAVFYFEAAGFLGLYGKRIAIALSLVFASFIVATIVRGPDPNLRLFNNFLVIGAFAALIVHSLNQKILTRDFVVIRRGLLLFAALVLFGNIADVLRHPFNVEPVGFVFFLATLGYVAARRTLHRDHELAEIQKELDIARRIQLANLPAAYPNTGRFRVAARYVPMTSVAGDFYDFLVADEHQAGLLIADVSGHGVPAALIASMVKLAASSQRANLSDPAALLSGMNTALCGNTQSQFVTAAYVHLDAAAGSLRYSAAAHPPLLLLRDGEVTEILENGLLLAVFPSASFSTTVRAIRPGDRILLYTDGIIEAADTKKEEFGQSRFCKLIQETACLPLEDTADRILAAVQKWSERQEDDLTLLICDFSAIA